VKLSANTSDADKKVNIEAIAKPPDHDKFWVLIIISAGGRQPCKKSRAWSSPINQSNIACGSGFQPRLRMTQTTTVADAIRLLASATHGQSPTVLSPQRAMPGESSFGIGPVDDQGQILQ